MVSKKTKYVGSFLIIGIMIFTSFSFVTALGVSVGYSNDIPLKMYPGQEKTVLLTLQNSDKEEDITVKGVLIEGSEIASLDADSYIVPYQSIDVSAKLTVEVPESASIGQTYPIVYEFKSVPGDESAQAEGGAVSVVYGVKRNFNVVVVEKPVEPEPMPVTTEQPEESNLLLWTIIIVLVVLVVVVVYFFVKKKK